MHLVFFHRMKTAQDFGQYLPFCLRKKLLLKLFVNFTVEYFTYSETSHTQHFISFLILVSYLRVANYLYFTFGDSHVGLIVNKLIKTFRQRCKAEGKLLVLNYFLDIIGFSYVMYEHKMCAVFIQCLNCHY